VANVKIDEVSSELKMAFPFVIESVMCDFRFADFNQYFLSISRELTGRISKSTGHDFNSF